MARAAGVIHGRMLRYERSRVAEAAQSILDEDGWCVVEVCVDVPAQRWEARLLICDGDPEVVADAIEQELACDWDSDLRLTGCDRRTLRPDPGKGSHLCHVQQTPTRSTGMLVRDGMNPVIVTVGPEHTLREAARRMTARRVGAAVVVDDSQPGPGIVTERDILASNGLGQDIDDELVRDHLTSRLVYAAADWSLEQAADAMVRGAFRHVIVLDGPEVVGILSMRDIVRCWTTDGATCEIGG